MERMNNALESRRLVLQSELDAKKTQGERNRLGQFATPTALAVDILNYAKALHPPGEPVCFLDPAVGTGAFYSALLRVFPKHQIETAVGFEIDPHYQEPSVQFWSGSGLDLKLADFTREEPSPQFNLVICNPPYVRHHHLQNGEKGQLQHRSYVTSGMKLSGLAGLYCHFLGLSNAWMTEGAIAGWLIPSEFMDVNYGRAVKRYLLEEVTLLQIHRFDPTSVQFTDALVSSAIVWFKKTRPNSDHTVTFSFGGTLLEPSVVRQVSARDLAAEAKWTRFPLATVRARNVSTTLSDLFTIKRGLATGDNDFFILDANTIEARRLPMSAFRPILPSPRYLDSDEVAADVKGLPILDRRLFLLDTRLSEGEIHARFPTLFAYLEEGKSRGVHNRYLCQHRAPWYSQENRPPAPLLCTYLGRGDSKGGRPFRFILNNSKATVSNVYLAMYPSARLTHTHAEDPNLMRRIWEFLNQLKPDQLLSEGRVYGGGLHKLEPRELANVAVGGIADLIPQLASATPSAQLGLAINERRSPAYNASQRTRN